MNRKPRLLFYFLHLLGVGHVFRAKRLIEGFAAQGIAVDIVYGGEPIEGMTFAAENIHYLPPIRAADGTYQVCLDEQGNPLSKDYQNLRTQKLIEVFAQVQPDMILIEAFPFGRRMVRHELLALLKEASSRPNPPSIVSSVRDILQEKRKPGRHEEARDWTNKYFDHVLVHSDPNIIRLDQTFPLAGEISEKLAYTGFVVPQSQPAKPPQSSKFNILVSAGGGAFGGDLMRCALMAAKSDPDRKWCLSTGPNLPERDSSELREKTPANVEIVVRLEGLAAHMEQADISISQCGYNTAMDVLSIHKTSPCRAVFVPYDTEGQTEQLRRAELLSQAGYSVCLPQSKLNPDSLLKAIDTAKNLGKVDRAVNFNGVTTSAHLVRQWMDERLAQMPEKPS